MQTLSANSAMSTYTVPSAGMGDEGAYLCRAQNEAGQMEDMVQVIVRPGDGYYGEHIQYWGRK